MVRRARLDAELVRRGLARSRGQAAELVVAGRVTVGGQVATKAATAIGPDDPLLVISDDDQPALCLARRREAGGRTWPRSSRSDYGSPAVAVSTPAPRPADSPMSCCVAAPRLLSLSTSATGNWRGRCAPTRESKLSTARTCATSPRDRSVRPIELIVADLSFISLTVVLPALIQVAAPDADLV